MNSKNVVNNLRTIVATENELKSEVITAFSDYDFEGVQEIIVEFNEDFVIQAFANHPQAPIFYILYAEKDGICKVKFASVSFNSSINV